MPAHDGARPSHEHCEWSRTKPPRLPPRARPSGAAWPPRCREGQCARGEDVRPFPAIQLAPVLGGVSRASGSRVGEHLGEEPGADEEPDRGAERRVDPEWTGPSSPRARALRAGERPTRLVREQAVIDDDVEGERGAEHRLPTTRRATRRGERARSRRRRGTERPRPPAGTRCDLSGCTTCLHLAEETARHVLHPHERVRRG